MFRLGIRPKPKWHNIDFVDIAYGKRLRYMGADYLEIRLNSGKKEMILRLDKTQAETLANSLKTIAGHLKK
jgi:hypothetical protein